MTTRGRPRLALAMTPGLAPAAFGRSHLDRLAAVADVIDREPLGTFECERAGEVLGNCEVLVGHWGCPLLDAAALSLAPRLALFAYGAGTVKETVTRHVFARGVLVTSAAAANAVPVAEFTLAAILLANKGAFLSREHLRDRSVSARRPRPLGNVGKRIGLIGASHVGRLVIDLLRPFELDVVVADPFLSSEGAAELGVTKVELDELMATSDVVSVHAPHLPSTQQLVGATELQAMKDGAVLINTARGVIVDADALTEELATGRISAVLDVTDPEPLPAGSTLLQLPNAFVTPHIAGSQGSELARLADLAVTEVERFVAGRPPLHPVTAADLDRIA